MSVDRLKPLRKRWKRFRRRRDLEMLEAALSGADDDRRERAEAAIAAIEKAGAGTVEELEVLFELWIERLEGGESAEQIGALGFLGSVVGRIDVRPFVELAGRLLGRVETASNALFFLRKCASRGIDITVTEEQLEPLLSSSRDVERYAASRALSENRRQTGVEPRIRPPYFPKGTHDRWDLEVSYRRIWALNDDPIDASDSHWRYESSRMCGACRGDETHCIYHRNYSDNTGTGLLYEYVCRACGKYTLWDYG